MIHPPQVRPEEPIAVTPHDGICGGESQQWLSYPTNPHVRFDERGRETERCHTRPKLPRPSSTLRWIGFRGDLWAPLSKGTQRLAQQDTGSFCFHPLHPLRPGFTCLRKLLTQLPNPACRAECASIHLGNPGQDDRPCDGRAGPHG